MFAVILLGITPRIQGQSHALELVGMVVTPHVQSDEMRYRRPPDPELGARVELILRNSSDQPVPIDSQLPLDFDGRTPAELLAAGEWAWHDTPSARPETAYRLPPGAVTVWKFNGRGARWAAGTQHSMQVGMARGSESTQLALDKPRIWLSAVTFLGSGDRVQPSRIVAHIQNGASDAYTISRCRLWLPEDGAKFLALSPQTPLTVLESFPSNGAIPAYGKAGFTAETGPLPLTYAVVEVILMNPQQQEFSLWAHLRIRREVFDISGGWVSSNVQGRSSLTYEPYLKTLMRMHINTGHIGEVSGYTDNPMLYERYPLKLFNRLQPVERFDRDEMLPRIHAVEFLGEPQYGGGRPVPPQEVWGAFVLYQPTRLATSVTHSEERIWRYYAGLSDYPHYDAYRVTAPSPDAWSRYDRWDGQQLRWGAPLETIGAMTRSLRELNRPRSIAYWSQGAHSGWGRSGGRSRTSPTDEELRAQAYHALAHRITSLYWFNLSLESLVKFPDLIEPITRVNREILLMDQLLLEGDAFEYRRLARDGRPDWDLASVAGPNGVLLFALDLDYKADLEEKLFRFREREARLTFALPPWLGAPQEVFRLSADGTHDVNAEVADGALTIDDSLYVAGIYVAAAHTQLRKQLDRELANLLDREQSFAFDPAKADADFAVLQSLAEQSQ
jgi:hypothetical protein